MYNEKETETIEEYIQAVKMGYVASIKWKCIPDIIPFLRKSRHKNREYNRYYYALVKNGMVENVSKKIGFKGLKKLAEDGYVPAMLSLGICYDYGKGTEENPEEALKWYKKAADAGMPGAMRKIGYLYDKGRILEKNEEKAFHLYSLAAENEDTYAMDRLGNHYYYSEEGKNIPLAMKWWTLAADEGIIHAMKSLGKLYVKGEETDFNAEEGIRLYAMAALKGDDDAQLILGEIYRDGIIVKRNMDEAIKWFRMQAEGDPRNYYGKYYLGLIYQSDEYGVRNEAEAFKWMKFAADTGYPPSFFALGQMYENGIGTEKSLSEAETWYTYGALEKNADAEEALERLGCPMPKR